MIFNFSGSSVRSSSFRYSSARVHIESNDLLKVLYLVFIDTKSLMVINYSGHCIKMAIELNWIISISISGIVAIVGIIFIGNILTKRSGRNDTKMNGCIC
jgi:hypothetical protein